ncbi:MAG: endonuclease III [Prevotella sp.]|nr:endonuclease III [Prevotella sp.]MBQ9236866.1 endonuclease III [Prevotella sp.]MBR1840129.1 endonuclease III [Prevotella sp.]
MTIQQRYDKIFAYFRKEQPIVDTELEFGSVFQLLVAVVLSAQCTDKRINLVTPALFQAYPDAKAMAGADEFEIYEYIKSVSYPNAKARHLVELAKMLVEEYDGEVPSDMDALLRLPGVGRKTANVMQAVAFRMNAMPVDTHVYRVSHRLGLVPKSCNTPYKVEQYLLKHLPQSPVNNHEAADAHHWLLLHGRYICKSLRPLCSKCPFDSFCPKLLEGSKL